MNYLDSSKKQKYSIAAACFMIQAVGVGTFVTYGVFFNSLLAEFGWPRAVISGASSLAFILSGMFAILVGRLSDMYGPRTLMSATSILFGVGFMLMSRVSEVWQLYLFYGVIFGIGLSGVDVIALTTTARWFSRSRGMMTGIVKVGTGAGQFTIPFLASVLIVSFGWRQTYVILGAAALLLLFLIAQVLKRDPESVQAAGNNSGKGDVQEKTMQDGLGSRQAMTTHQMWLLLISTVLTEFCLLTMIVHIVPHAADLGLSAPQAAGVLSTIGAVSMLGRFASGIWVDRLGSKTVMIVNFIILLLSLAWLQISDSLLMLYLFGAVYGLAHGGFFTAISPLVAEIFGITAHGALFGIVVFAGAAGGSVGPIIAGRIFDMTGSYSLVFQLITVFAFVGMILMICIKPLKGAVRQVVV